MPVIKKEIFRQYDIRGIVGVELDRDIAFKIGRAFAVYLREANPDARHVSVGRDVRINSRELAEGVIDGIISAGIDVTDIGECPTPLQYFSLYHLSLDGGIMVTGSHNPPEYNGFKLSVGKETIYGDAIQRLREIILKGDKLSACKQGKANQYDILEPYRQYMLNEFSYLSDSKYRRLTIVVDAGNGTAGVVAPDILRNIGCDVIPLFCEPDGTFPNHHPDPTVVEYVQDMINKTKESNADFGVGYDGDADRIGIVDKNGDIIWGDQLMIILSREALKQMPGAKIVGDVKCSQLMFDDIHKHGGIPVMWKTGHSLIKQKMREEKAVMAGEFSGHIFIADRYYGYDDAIYTTLRLVEILKKSGKTISELLSDIRRTFFTPEIRIGCADEKKGEVIEKVVSRFLSYMENRNSEYEIKDVKTIDGIRAVFENGWGLVRMSNTQPAIVMRVEAENEQSLNDYKAFFERELRYAVDAL